MKKATLCSDKNLALLDQAAFSAAQITELKRLFKMMANETRLQMLHALIRSEEMCVNDLANALGMKPQAISNQLQRMADKGILESRREGTSIFYKIIDPCIPEILDRAFCLIEMPEKAARARPMVRHKR